MRSTSTVLLVLIVTGCSKGEDVREFKGHNKTVHSVAFSPNCKYVLSGGDDGMFLWDATTAKELHRYPKGVYSVAFSPDGSRILCGGFDKTVRLWDVEKWSEVRRFEGHGGYVYAVAFSPDGKRAITAGGAGLRIKDGKILTGDCSLHLWDLAKGNELRRFEGHKGPVWRLAFSPDGKQILSSSSDRTFRLWDTETGKQLRRWGDSEHETTIEFLGSIAFSTDGRRALVGGSLYNTDNWQTIRELSGDVFSPDGKRTLTAGSGGTIRLLDVDTAKELWQTYGHKNQAPVRSVAFSPDGKYALSGGQGTVGWSRKPFEDHVVRMWKLPE